MSVYMIAKLKKDEKIIGYRLYDTESKQKAEWQTSRVIEALKFKKKIRNLSLDSKGYLKGTMGALKDYPTIDVNTGMILDFNGCTVVGYDSVERTYHVVDALGTLTPFYVEELIKRIDNPEFRRMMIPSVMLKKYGDNYINIGLTNATIERAEKVEKSTLKGVCKSIEDIGFKYKYLEKVFKTPNNLGQVQEWKVRIVKHGEPYGRQGCLINDKESTAEFYSLDTNQFVSSYYVSTLLEEDMNYGLALYGDVPAWSIGVDNLAPIIKWLKGLKL